MLPSVNCFLDFQGLRVYPIGLIVLGIFGCFPTPAKADEKASARIVIVGAGSAGIATASKLFEAGFNNITILEAEDRIGGRVHTTLLGNFHSFS